MGLIILVSLLFPHRSQNIFQWDFMRVKTLQTAFSTMKDKDFRAITESEYPWRIELCLKTNAPVNFIWASADTTHEGATTLARLLMRRFMAEQAIVTPIIVNKTMTEEQIRQETNRLTTVIS